MRSYSGGTSGIGQAIARGFAQAGAATVASSRGRAKVDATAAELESLGARTLRIPSDVQSIAFLTFGEGLHNNHHEYPTSARFALRGHEIDPAWPVIRLLEACNLAKVRQLPIAKAAA